MQGSISFDGALTGGITGGDTVVITPVVTSGTKIADVTVNGVEKDLYAPSIEFNPAVPATDEVETIDLNGTIYDVKDGDARAEINQINQSLSDLEEHGYIVTRWVTFSYFNASQLEGTYSVPTVPSGYSVRLLGCMPTFANSAMGVKFSGKFLSSTGNKLRALGSGFASGDSESFLVLFLVYKS